jgi:hypothetical protein
MWQQLSMCCCPTPFVFGLAFLYFWLLDRFEETGWFYVILIAGLAIGLV